MKTKRIARRLASALAILHNRSMNAVDSSDLDPNRNPPSKLHSSADIEQLWETSHQEPVFLLKHSLICGTSHAALEQYTAFAASHAGKARFSILEIQPHRDLSREVEERSGVRHQSPQVLLVQNGQVDWSVTHWSITEARLLQALSAAS